MNNRGEQFYLDFYKAQNIIQEDEMEEFKECISIELPSTFWICCPKIQNAFYSEMLLGKIREFLNVALEDGGQRIQPITWAFLREAYQINLSRHQIKKNEPFKDLKKFLFTQMEAGFIRRQETVSMIPPLLMDIKPHHKVLDLCSAPGSKTAQVLEYLLKDNEDIFQYGFLIANDNNLDRCCLMLHQLQCLAFPNLVVTCCDARTFPILTDLGGNPVLFDRILADVPCSSDGTIRKSPDILRSWTPSNAISLHGMQKNILKRGIQLLAVGGRIVYSTCSLNPLEDEAVITAVLEQDDSVRLVPVLLDSFGDSLLSRPGLEEWKVIIQSGEINDWDGLPTKLRKDDYKTLFPSKNASKYNLHYCRRVLPQFQNTGGFFYAVLEKISESTISEQVHMDDFRRVGAKRTKRDGRLNSYDEECFHVPASLYSEITSTYGLSFLSPGVFRFRGKSQRSVLIVNEPLADLMEANHTRLTIVGIGVKAIKKQGNFYRLMSSVANTPFFGHRASVQVVLLTASDILAVLTSESVDFGQLSSELAVVLSEKRLNGFFVVRCCGVDYDGADDSCEMPSFVAQITTKVVRHMLDKIRRDTIMLIYREFLKI